MRRRRAADSKLRQGRARANTVETHEQNRQERNVEDGHDHGIEHAKHPQQRDGDLVAMHEPNDHANESGRDEHDQDGNGVDDRKQRVGVWLHVHVQDGFDSFGHGRVQGT
ncbi:hypothetical protein BCR44DRAFT_1432618 [Catenaria anguillulae PL171]|uniref:Uncharacterized protein n=1 Tax=Catenaria anguillulae PL171 TaxID=765915 RepID=A0A1Y2HTD8_9FUNG|nr:hypothetical protein BCR44DRAFT_1432618 [Catenaria anguillulae PL171]